MDVRAALISLGVGVVCAAFAWLIGTGFWLVTQTDYPYFRSVGGGALIVGTLGLIVGLFEVDE